MRWQTRPQVSCPVHDKIHHSPRAASHSMKQAPSQAPARPARAPKFILSNISLLGPL
jgi:hypothetical protein